MGGSGSGGHNRKSDATKKAMGTFRKDRSSAVYDANAKKAATPTTEPAKPFTARMPSFLDSEARSCWRRTLKEAGSRLRNEDVDALTSMCVSFSLWKNSVTKLQADGPVLVVKGIPKRNPLVQIVAEYQRAYLASAKFLGIGDAGYRNKSTASVEETLAGMSDEQLAEAAQIQREREGIVDEEEES